MALPAMSQPGSIVLLQRPGPSGSTAVAWAKVSTALDPTHRAAGAGGRDATGHRRWHTRRRGETVVNIVTRPDTLLPDPEPRPVRYTVISVDDHLVEPPDMFEGRLPGRFADRAPRWSRTPGAISCGSSTATATHRSA